MDVGAIVSKFQELHLEIEGVVSAPTEMPGALVTEMLPCVLVYPGPAEHAVPFYAGRKEMRDWLVRLYVWPIGQGQGVDEGYQRCLPFLDRFQNKYHRPGNLAPADGMWQELRSLEDGGVRADLTLHGSGVGQVYWGLEFTVGVKIKEVLE